MALGVSVTPRRLNFPSLIGPTVGSTLTSILNLFGAVLLLFCSRVALSATPDLVFGADTVFDRANNLTWTKDASSPGPAACLPGTTKDWVTANGTYINCLNSSNYLGYSDWRIPSLGELSIFRDNGLLGSTLYSMNLRFVLTGDTWTSSEASASTAWIVSLYLGSTFAYSKTMSIAVWPVRGPTNGACGTSSGGTSLEAPASSLCSSGTASSVSGNGPWSWTCSGSNGGTIANCQASFGLPPIPPYTDVRFLSASQLSRYVVDKQLMATLWFNQSTPWSPQYQTLAQDVLEKGKNPGLGVRSLHAKGITGKGITVAIIDQNLASLNHPEYSGKIVGFLDRSGYPSNFQGSMHGPSVSSLLVGKTIGTAPDANLYYVALPQGLSDAQYEADALDWIVAQNLNLPTDQKIRVVSISAAPSGPSSPRTSNNAAWDAAVLRAISAGVLVLDCTADKGLTDVAYLDLDDPDNLSKVSSYSGGVSAGKIYIPTSRSQAQEFSAGDFSYQYTGRGGPSWTVPYLAGVLAMGWQLRPELTGAQMLGLIFDSAYVNGGMKVINPVGFIDRVKNFPSSTPTLSFVAGWNLVGDSVEAPITVASTFGDSTMVNSVWKWISSGSKWAFYTPTQTDGGAAYAATKGYDLLTSINGGEAFWVNAHTTFTAPLPSGTAVTSTSFQTLPSGWSLISIGSNRTPSGFNSDLSVSPPAAGVVPQNIATLWAWDSAQSKWYFYAPSLQMQGGSVLSDYIRAKGYLDFTTANKVLGPGVGFWVNKP